MPTSCCGQVTVRTKFTMRNRLVADACSNSYPMIAMLRLTEWCLSSPTPEEEENIRTLHLSALPRAASDSTQVQDFYKAFSGPGRKKAITWGWRWGDPRGWGQGNVHHCWRATWGQVEVVGRCLLFCSRRRR